MSERSTEQEAVTPRKRRFAPLIAATAAASVVATPFAVEGINNYNRQSALDKQELAVQAAELQRELDGKLGTVAEQVAAAVLKHEKQKTKTVPRGDLLLIVPEDEIYPGQSSSAEIKFNTLVNNSGTKPLDVVQVRLLSVSTGESTSDFSNSQEYVFTKNPEGWRASLTRTDNSKKWPEYGGMNEYDASLRSLLDAPKENRTDAIRRIKENMHAVLSGQEGLFDTPMEMTQRILSADK